MISIYQIKADTISNVINAFYNSLYFIPTTATKIFSIASCIIQRRIKKWFHKVHK